MDPGIFVTSAAAAKPQGGSGGHSALKCHIYVLKEVFVANRMIKKCHMNNHKDNQFNKNFLIQ